LHAPEVECISKGKAHVRYEFGVKASIVATLKQGLVVGARSMPGNPYDGHTLHEALEQAAILSNVEPKGCSSTAATRVLRLTMYRFDAPGRNAVCHAGSKP
jgi:hypothetical protein